MRPEALAIWTICSARYFKILWQNPHDRAMAYKLPKLSADSLPIRLHESAAAEQGSANGAQRPIDETRSLEPLQLAHALKKMAAPKWVESSRRRAGFVKPAVAIGVTAVLVAVTLLGPNLFADRFSAASAAGEGGDEKSLATADGQRLVAESARRLLAESSIKANVRFKASAYGHEVVGVGSYLQLGDGPEKLLRLEMKSQVGDQTATLQEICSEDEYWVRRDVPQLTTTVGRASLRPIRQAIARMSKDPQVDPIQTWIILGGLPRMMEELHRSFNFSPATASEVEFTSADGRSVERMPVWIVTGEWKQERLDFLTGNKTPENLAKLPQQLPTRVELILGRVDHAFPLFPYRISYLRPRGQSGTDEPPTADPGSFEPLCTLEFYGVYHTSDIDPREFAYDPGDQEVADLTQHFMVRLGLVGK